MSDQALTKNVSLGEIFSYFFKILGPERNYYTLAIVYGVGISILALGLPISVQMLVNTVAHTGLTTPLFVLTGTLFVLLLGAGLLNALRIHLMDLFQRRFYARMVSSIALRSVYALNPFFQDYNKGTLFNRYFDILIVQKTVPNLLVGGFAIILQAAVGFTLTSLYHPLFLAFNLVVILMIWLIWLIWGGRAIRSAVEVSHKKHAAAAWIEGLGRIQRLLQIGAPHCRGPAAHGRGYQELYRQAPEALPASFRPDALLYRPVRGCQRRPAGPRRLAGH